MSRRTSTNILNELAEHERQSARATHWRLAQEAFSHTAAYDPAVSSRLAQIDAEGQTTSEELPSRLHIAPQRTAILRYGENPHQQAALYSFKQGGIAGAEQLHGKELSYNNLVDLDAAWQLVQEFESPAAAIIKHTNPCGCAEQPSLKERIRKRLKLIRYPLMAVCWPLIENLTRRPPEVSKFFVEAIAAPAFSKEALAILTAKKNLRLVRVLPVSKRELVIKSISGGLLAQTADDARWIYRARGEDEAPPTAWNEKR